MARKLEHLGPKIATSVALLLCTTGVVGSCIVHDTDIQVEAPGHDWCGRAENAQGWNNPLVKVDLKVEDEWPEGCTCLAGCNDEKMQDWLDNGPPMMNGPGWDEWISNVQLIRNAVLNACIAVKNDMGFASSSCAAAAFSATFYRKDAGSPDCSYILDEGESGGPECVSELGPGDPDDFITCSAQGNCDVDEVLVEQLYAAPAFLLGERGYAKFESNGMKLYNVASSDIIYMLGFRTGDILLSVDGDSLATEASALDALLRALPRHVHERQREAWCKHAHVPLRRDLKRRATMRRMKRALVVTTGFLLGLACSRHIEEDVDAERLCRDFCDLGELCRPAAPEWAEKCPSVDDPCFDTCMDNGNRGWEDDCRFLLADYFECINDLTCEDFYGQSACSTVPREEQACEQERGAYSTCASKQ